MEQAGEVELRREDNLVDARLGALVEAVNAEGLRVSNGRLFLDAVEQALAVALVNGMQFGIALCRRTEGPRLRTRAKDQRVVDAKMEDELTICEMAQAVQLSTAHFCGCFASQPAKPRIIVLRHR